MRRTWFALLLVSVASATLAGGLDVEEKIPAEFGVCVTKRRRWCGTTRLVLADGS
jgi:hypothetical protein